VKDALSKKQWHFGREEQKNFQSVIVVYLFSVTLQKD